MTTGHDIPYRYTTKSFLSQLSVATIFGGCPWMVYRRIVDFPTQSEDCWGYIDKYRELHMAVGQNHVLLVSEHPPNDQTGFCWDVCLQ